MSFLRDEGVARALSNDLKERGCSGVADILAAAKLPRFIEWRWSKLRDVLFDLDGFWRSLRAVMDLSLFTKPKDKKRLARVTKFIQTNALPVNLIFCCGFVFGLIISCLGLVDANAVGINMELNRWFVLARDAYSRRHISSQQGN